MEFPLKLKKRAPPQLFENLSDESLQTLLQQSILQNYENGRLLVQQGDTPEHLYLIIEGALKTFRINENGDEATIRMLQSGETCMDAVIFMGGPSPINVQTIGDTEVLMIPERAIKRHVLDDAQFSLNLLRIVTTHYKKAMQQIDAINIKTPIQRMGYYFLQQHIEHGTHGLDVKIPFKKQEVANYLGMTPETFSRTLKKMESFGINIESDHIKLLDSFSLCHFCDSDTAAQCTRHNDPECKTCPLHK